MSGYGRGKMAECKTLGRGKLMMAMMAMKLKKNNNGPKEIKETIILEQENSICKETVSEEVVYQPDINNRYGKSGTKVDLMVNYIELNTSLNGVHQYYCSFNPMMDSKMMACAMLYQHSDIIGKGRAFDGSTLYLSKKLDSSVTNLKSETREGETINIQVKYVKLTPFNQMLNFYNVLFNKILRILKYERIGQNYYDPINRLVVPQHKLEVWPGYVTRVNETEMGLLLQCDTSHRVVSTQTVYEMMKNIYNKNTNNFSKLFSETIIGLIVVTRYNNKNYRIDDFSTETTPMSTFKMKNGETTSYLQYYKNHYNITIQDKDQPLLFSKPKLKGLKNSSVREDLENQVICLVPELCYITGLTDEIRSDFRVMKDLASHTRMSPSQRVQSLRQFCINVNESPESKDELDKWGLKLKTNLIEMTGRVIPRETIYFGNAKYTCDHTASWNRDVVRKRVVTPVDIQNWLLIYTNRDNSKGQDFKKIISEVTVPMGFSVGQPTIVVLSNDKIESYANAIKKHYSNNLQLVVVIFPTSRDDRYNAIKRICSSENPVLSQVINSNTLKPNKIRSVIQKIALQINCKLGGELWTLNIPSKVLMVCGIDVYHDTVSKANSVVGFVSSMNSTCSRWYSSVKMQNSGEEIISCLNECFFKAITKYFNVNGQLPERIVIYRDGVGDGQLDTVMSYENMQMVDVFKRFRDDYNPKFTVIICQKRINAKIMKIMNSEGPKNPEPGTIVDTKITKKNMIDFYLISQYVTQGTVTPTHYIVLYDTSDWSIDNIQKLTYKLTHMYYNWPGTIRSPAPCQYAHKIAYQVGQNTKTIPNENLCDKLYYL